MASTPPSKPRRKYEQLWCTLKALKRVAIVPTQSKDPAVFRQFCNTVRKAVQKEKYMDDTFRVLHPNATLTSKAELEFNKLSFTLDLVTPVDPSEFTPSEGIDELVAQECPDIGDL